jgi:hypothetical protein
VVVGLHTFPEQVVLVEVALLEITLARIQAVQVQQVKVLLAAVLLAFLETTLLLVGGVLVLLVNRRQVPQIQLAVRAAWEWHLLFLAHLFITLAAVGAAYLLVLEVQRVVQAVMAVAGLVRYTTARVIMLAAVQMEP